MGARRLDRGRLEAATGPPSRTTRRGPGGPRPRTSSSTATAARGAGIDRSAATVRDDRATSCARLGAEAAEPGQSDAPDAGHDPHGLGAAGVGGGCARQRSRASASDTRRGRSCSFPIPSADGTSSTPRSICGCFADGGPSGASARRSSRSGSAAAARLSARERRPAAARLRPPGLPPLARAAPVRCVRARAARRRRRSARRRLARVGRSRRWATAQLPALFDRIAVSDIAWARIEPWRRAIAGLWPGVGDAGRVLRCAARAPRRSFWRAGSAPRLGATSCSSTSPRGEIELVEAGSGRRCPSGWSRSRLAISSRISSEIFGRDPIYEEAVSQLLVGRRLATIASACIMERNASRRSSGLGAGGGSLSRMRPSLPGSATSLVQSRLSGATVRLLVGPQRRRGHEEGGWNTCREVHLLRDEPARCSTLHPAARGGLPDGTTSCWETCVPDASQPRASSRSPGDRRLWTATRIANLLVVNLSDQVPRCHSPTQVAERDRARGRSRDHGSAEAAGNGSRRGNRGRPGAAGARVLIETTA